MEIQITTNSGQKFVMKGEEFAEGFLEHLREMPSHALDSHAVEIASEELSSFLATYEEKPKWDTGGPWVCEEHPDQPFPHNHEGVECIGPGMPPLNARV